MSPRDRGSARPGQPWTPKKKVAAVCLLFSFVTTTLMPVSREPNIAAAADRSPSVAESVKEADLVIVGRVIGLIDPTPVARTRKHLEGHWIRVEDTLKGIDETGERLRARPNGLLWEDGNSYVMFLRRTDGGWVDALPRYPLGPEASIGVVIDEVAAQRGQVIPKPVLSMKQNFGPNARIRAEFTVSKDGTFYWTRSDSGDHQYERRTGRLPSHTLTALIRQIEDAGPGPVVDDSSSTITLAWRTAAGETRARGYSVPEQPPAADLLQAIETLVLRYGHQ
jgi:hypothetical protein